MVKFGGSRRVRQPQQAARINRRNHLGAAVQHYQTGIDAGGWTAVNGPSKSVSAVGVNTSFASASSQYLKENSKVTGYPFTFAAVVKRRTTGIDQSIISIGAATNDRHLLYFTAADTVAAFSGAGATFDQAISTATFVDTNKYYVVVAVYASATDRKVYVDGVLQAASTGAVSPAAADTAVLGAYWTSGAPVANFYFNGEIPISLISNKAWSAEQVTDWNKNHWQIFQPRKQAIYVNLSASTNLVTAADSLTPSFTESLALLSASSVNDIATPSVTESVGLAVLVSAVDTLTPSATETANVIAAVITTDTLTPTLIETQASFVTSALSEAFTLSLGETQGSLLASAVTDVATISVTESAAVLVAMIGADTYIVSITDTAAVVTADIVAKAVTESLTLNLTEVASVVTASLWTNKSVSITVWTDKPDASTTWTVQ